ncbi:MAG: hypothetical protein PCFJNLEI_02917 [Verrucomicrobiae bacterium]|nr:hypothetical protein [Verrucomicrobiae bacterium]
MTVSFLDANTKNTKVYPANQSKTRLSSALGIFSAPVLISGDDNI